MFFWFETNETINFSNYMYSMCFFFVRREKNDSGEFSPNYRRFSRTLEILFARKKNTYCEYCFLNVSTVHKNIFLKGLRFGDSLEKIFFCTTCTRYVFAGKDFFPHSEDDLKKRNIKKTI
jgi:hypothetical protein